MTAMQTRAKDNVPNVLLTLLSIIQALALELLWGQLRAADYLFQAGWTTSIYWLQSVVTFLGIVVIWVVYVSNVMRFRWIPGISDSVLPFLIGVAEFLLIESIGPAQHGQWFLFLALIFALMHGTAHMTMRRARRDGENELFFRNLEPATVRDFYPAMATVVGLVVLGCYLHLAPGQLTVAFVGALATLGLLSWQAHGVARFWRLSMLAQERPADGIGEG